jgi:hypothetical protein
MLEQVSPTQYLRQSPMVAHEKGAAADLHGYALIVVPHQRTCPEDRCIVSHPEPAMQPEAPVLRSSFKTLEVPYRGQSHSATYFVEDGMVHAEICGRTMLAPANAQAPEDVVRTLVVGKLEQQQRRRRLLSTWQDWQCTARRPREVSKVAITICF